MRFLFSLAALSVASVALAGDCNRGAAQASVFATSYGQAIQQQQQTTTTTTTVETRTVEAPPPVVFSQVVVPQVRYVPIFIPQPQIVYSQQFQGFNNQFGHAQQFNNRGNIDQRGLLNLSRQRGDDRSNVSQRGLINVNRQRR